MAKKCLEEKNKRVSALIARHAAKRAELKAIISNPETAMDEKHEAYKALNKLPRNSSPVRGYNRCRACGRPHAYMRKFQLCRICFRTLSLEGKLPGVTKSSW